MYTNGKDVFRHFRIRGDWYIISVLLAKCAILRQTKGFWQVAVQDVMRVRTLDIAEANRPLAEYARQVDAGPIVVTAEGRPIVAVFSIENADLETISLSTNPQFLALIQRSRSRQESEGGISSDEMRRRLGLD